MNIEPTISCGAFDMSLALPGTVAFRMPNNVSIGMLANPASLNPTGAFTLSMTTANNAQVRNNNVVGSMQFSLNAPSPAAFQFIGNGAGSGALFPAKDDGTAQLNAGFLGGLGAPNNANGTDGMFYFRSDGGALTTIYQRRAGSWVGIV
jgi:hypothetical protein